MNRRGRRRHDSLQRSHPSALGLSRRRALAGAHQRDQESPRGLRRMPCCLGVRGSVSLDDPRAGGRSTAGRRIAASGGGRARATRLPRTQRMNKLATASTLLPLRLMVGFGFAAHGYAKLSRGPENFATILAAIGVPQPHLAAWLTSLL